jgi:hypothetical protein
MKSRGRLRLTRAQVIAFRRHAQSLDERLPASSDAVRRAAWAGLQDSMPRAALLSLHARVAGITPASWEAPPLVQVWGPRYSLYVVDERDVALFTVARMPPAGATRRTAEDLAARMVAAMGTGRMPHDEVARRLGEPPNRLRYATLTGRLRLRWDGARQATLWMVAPPGVEPDAARREMARRFLHVAGPAPPEAFAAWAGLAEPVARATFAALGDALVPVRLPTGDGVLLAADEDLARQSPDAPSGARLLPSGDIFCLHQRQQERALLVPEPEQRARLWTSRVWPGAVLVNGDIAGTWRRAGATVVVEPWRRLSRIERQAVDAEAASLPLPGVAGDVTVQWQPG